MEKYHIQELILEVTRECNMHCAHCLRGNIPDSENKQMSTDMITEILSHIKHIDHIVFTGGEPTLAILQIKHTIKTLKQLNIPIKDFYLVTNGKQITHKFLCVIDELYDYCMMSRFEKQKLKDKTPIEQYRCLNWGLEEFYGGVALSIDSYHEPVDIRNMIALKSRSYFREDKITNINGNEENLLLRGRAKNLDIPASIIVNKPINRFYANKEYGMIEQLYINTNGDIMADCDLDYQMQQTYQVANIHDTDCFDKIFAVAEEL